MLRRKSRLNILADACEDTAGLPRYKRSKTGILYDKEEKNLEELVFGGQPFSGTNEKDLESYELSDSDSDEKDEKAEQQRKDAVWCDEDDDVIRVDLVSNKGLRKLRKTQEETIVSGRIYTERLRTQFLKLSQQPLWSLDLLQNSKSKGDSSEDEEGGEELLQRTSRLLASSVQRLPKGVIDIKNMKDANHSKRAQAVMQAVEFHPSASAVLTAGLHKTLSLFQIDGENNSLLQSIFLQRFPILTAHFTASGEEVIMAAEKHWFYVFDLLAGKVTMINEIKGHSKEIFSKFQVSPDNQLIAFQGRDGYIPLLSNKTKQWIADLKMNGSVSDVAFTPNSRHLLSTGSDGQVYVWDLNTRDCIHRFIDDGCVRGTSLAVSPNGRHVACGSDSGIVNLYSESCLHEETPKPVRSFMNLTTAVDWMTFNPTSEILGISSQKKASALKLIHLSSQSVFSNWPTPRTPLDHVFCFDFSSNSHHMIVGNDRGRAQLYRLNHYHTGRSVQ